MPTIIAGLEKEIAIPGGRSDIIIFDDKLRGFFLRVAKTGISTYGVDYRVLGKRRRMSLGPVGGATALTAARREAQRVLAKAKLGDDVLADRKASAERRRSTFGQLVPKFLADREKQLRKNTRKEWTRYLTNHLKSLNQMDVADLERKDIVEQIDRIAVKYPVAADRAKTALSAFFAWCIEQQYRETNPVSRLARRSQNSSRERVLDDGELVEVWHAAGDGDYGNIVRLLILTGQRRDEIGWLRWSEIDENRQALVLPPERVKNNRMHFLPISEQAMAVLGGVPKRIDREFVFGEADGAGYSGWSRSKRRMEGRIQKARKETDKKEMPDWVLHDLRRTFASGMARLGVDLHVTEKMLNHVSGTFSGVQGVYQRHSFEKEMRAAMKLWGEHVEKLLGITAKIQGDC